MAPTLHAAYPTDSNALLISTENLQAYLRDVRRRREQRRLTRQERERLTHGIALIQEELIAAQQDEDAEIAAELESVLTQFTQRLSEVADGLGVHAVVRSISPIATTDVIALASFAPAIPMPQESASDVAVPIEAFGDVAVSQAVEQASQAAEAFTSAVAGEANNIKSAVYGEPQPEAAPTQWAADEAVVAAASLPAEPAPLTAEERAERIAALASELETAMAGWREMDNQGLTRSDGELDRVRCLHMRALACLLGGLHARAHELGVGPEMRGTIVSVRESMELARAYASDTCACLPFDARYWILSQDPLAPAEWAEFSELYARTAEAQTAFEWYAAHVETLEPAARLPLLEAIAATQQMLFRALEEFGGKDRLQGDLFGNLRTAADEAGFLAALHPSMTWNELKALAVGLATLFANTQRAHDAGLKRKAREACQSTAIAAVLEWETARKSQALSKYTVDKQRAELLTLLDACLAAAVPATNVQVREALLHVGPVLLEGQEKHAKFLAAIQAERARRGFDTSKDKVEEKETGLDEEPSASQLADYTQYVSLWAEGQKVLILGGTPRQRVCEELEQRLACGEVKWPDSKKSDRTSKFRNDVQRADILIVIKNFASHEMTDKGREWMKAQGGHYILLPSGYGVNQIIHQLYNYATTHSSGTGDNSAAITPPLLVPALCPKPASGFKLRLA